MNAVTNVASTEPRWRRSRIEIILIAAATVNLAAWSLYSASHCSPLLDEPAHFASGIILGDTSDPGYFKVNPPLNKWITATIAPLANFELPPLVPSSEYSNSERPEFSTGDSILELNQDTYLAALSYARFARVPFLLLGAWLLWKVVADFPPACRVLVVWFWCFSPLVLGHGWVVSADALAGVAMCFILFASKQMWSEPKLKAFTLSGVAWGLAIGTKFTFAPLYIAYPLISELCMLASSPIRTARLDPRDGASQLPKSLLWKYCVRFVGRWTLHAAVACLTLNVLYTFDGTAIPIGKHDFVSPEFSEFGQLSVDEKQTKSIVVRVIAGLPSPFPKSFLEGIDQQLADMSHPRGAYLLGRRIDGQLPWFFAVGYWMKEQTAIPLAALIIGVTAVASRISRCSSKRNLKSALTAPSLSIFCWLSLVVFALLMATQCNLVWNIRYLIPALPLIYLLLATSLPSLNFSQRVTRRLGGLDVSCVSLCCAMLIEFTLVVPYHFSYINPIFGGSKRVPIALNDSNVDYGQDLFYIERWSKKLQREIGADRELQLFGVLSGHGRIWLKHRVPPATISMIVEALAVAEQPDRTPAASPASLNILIVSRGLTHPEPWATRYSTLRDKNFGSQSRDLLEQLLRLPPDTFITPTLAGYYLPAAESLH